MAYNYKLGYYNWSRIMAVAPEYDNRILGTYADALRLLDSKVAEFTKNLRPDVVLAGEAWDGKNSHSETTVYDYRHIPITAHIWIEEVPVHEYEF